MTSTLSGAEKRDLRARGQRLQASVRLGQAGITDAWLQSFQEELDRHELVKVRFTDPGVDRKAMAPLLAERSGSALVALVGYVAVYFRKKERTAADPDEHG